MNAGAGSRVRRVDCQALLSLMCCLVLCYGEEGGLPKLGYMSRAGMVRCSVGNGCGPSISKETAPALETRIPLLSSVPMAPHGALLGRFLFFPMNIVINFHN